MRQECCVRCYVWCQEEQQNVFQFTIHTCQVLQSPQHLPQQVVDSHQLSGEGSLAVAQMDPGCLLDNLDGSLHHEEYLKLTMPTVCLPYFPSGGPSPGHSLWASGSFYLRPSHRHLAPHVCSRRCKVQTIHVRGPHWVQQTAGKCQ